MMINEKKNSLSRNIIFDVSGVLFTPIGVTTDVVPKKIFAPLQRGIELLKKCHAKKNEHGEQIHRLYILSNLKTHNYEYLVQQHPDIFTFFHGVVISGTVALEKPDVRIYEHLLDIFQLHSSSCIFIDDFQENVHAAEKVGMKGVHCQDFDVVEQELIACGVL